jgi:hypothetical protein
MGRLLTPAALLLYPLLLGLFLYGFAGPLPRDKYLTHPDRETAWKAASNNRKRPLPFKLFSTSAYQRRKPLTFIGQSFVLQGKRWELTYNFL